jgi:hypothetical protein
VAVLVAGMIAAGEVGPAEVFVRRANEILRSIDAVIGQSDTR